VVLVGDDGGDDDRDLAFGFAFTFTFTCGRFRR
jgi:hypothetical protein